MLTLAENKRAFITLVAKDRKGRVVPNTQLDGVPAWNNSNPGVADLVIDAADPFKAELRFLDGPGTGQIRADVDVLPGADVKIITGLLDFETLALTASVVELQSTAPEDIPPVP